VEARHPDHWGWPIPIIIHNFSNFHSFSTIKNNIFYTFFLPQNSQIE